MDNMIVLYRTRPFLSQQLYFILDIFTYHFISSKIVGSIRIYKISVLFTSLYTTVNTVPGIE